MFTFAINQIIFGIYLEKGIVSIGSQPPKNKVTKKEAINIILEYSAKKKKANPIAEYSTLYPATNSASASGKSKGILLVSAKIDIKNIIANGKSGKIYHTVF